MCWWSYLQFVLLEMPPLCWKKRNVRMTSSNTENNFSLMAFFLFCKQCHFILKNGENKIFLFSKKCYFENTKNKKNKNNFLYQTSFQCFLFSRIEKQFLKTATKQGLYFLNGEAYADQEQFDQKQLSSHSLICFCLYSLF